MQRGPNSSFFHVLPQNETNFLFAEIINLFFPSVVSRKNMEKTAAAGISGSFEIVCLIDPALSQSLGF